MANDPKTRTESTSSSNQSKQCQALASRNDNVAQDLLLEKGEALSDISFSNSETSSPLLGFDKENDDEFIFPEPVDRIDDDEELFDLLIEQATLLSKTIFRYLMSVP